MTPTKFEDIYKRAIFKFTDYTFLRVSDDMKEAVMQNYLISSIVDFQPACEVNLEDYDLEKCQFNNELTSAMIEILAVGVAYYWLSSHVYNSVLLRNKIYNSDYTTYSPANLLKEASALQEKLRNEQLGLIKEYSFRNSSYETLQVQ